MQISGFTPLTYPTQRTPPAQDGRQTPAPDAPASKENRTVPGDDANRKTTELSKEDQQQIDKLQQRDREVRAHEAAHKAAAGQYATSAASFDYQRGPDGRLYASGGEVGIDTSPVTDNPEATVQKANQVRAAALAPAQPSGQDMAVASAAAMMATAARGEIMARQQGPTTDRTGTADTPQQQQIQQYQSIANISTQKQVATIDLIA
ncbi:MAG: putative metalloprotease CJM1_0395 family protein [Pseudomonadota bacterium]|nr:putative metalloprotease CJM1_0395 family protein [Pseudomonadota bacterium]